ncbi:hypothetical protein PQ472_09045 [Lacticaseibacillus pabuli]|uniref:Uncharacterized protein n=1 Tax=Lacticaseibacillus pabuli TaxID=3025672 RepID=A0ABY7WPD9_9LACO|nr:hypothetical protein [Lacticaseibacillus sp. KACC 23028]WDF82065.1 hypothetical protein PQ472_09045 [Lacticaseibacillus sp. KACC 23028]
MTTISAVAGSFKAMFWLFLLGLAAFTVGAGLLLGLPGWLMAGGGSLALAMYTIEGR